MTKIKLWVSDIDGTIVNYDSSYTNEMKNLINKINNSDVKFVLATGRMFQGAKYVADKFNIKTPIICYQGALVRTENEILMQTPIKTDIAYEVVDYFKTKNIHTHLYDNDSLYIDDDDKRIMAQYCNGRGMEYTVVNDLKQLNLPFIPKILVVIEDENLMQNIKTELREKYKGVLNIVQSTSMYLEINDINASKGNALEFLKKYWNLKDEEVLASGDHDNDIDLLNHAGIRVCVGNNSKKIQQVAQYHCKSVNSNELVDIIESMI